MATAPQYVTNVAPVARVVPATLTAANIATDGTGATGRALVVTANSSGFTAVPYLRVKPLGTGAATMIRVFRNNGSDPEVAGNNALLFELAVAASTLSQTAKMPEYDIPLNLNLAGHASTPERIYVTLSVAHTAGVKITPINVGDSA